MNHSREITSPSGRGQNRAAIWGEGHTSENLALPQCAFSPLTPLPEGEGNARFGRCSFITSPYGRGPNHVVIWGEGTP